LYEFYATITQTALFKLEYAAMAHAATGTTRRADARRNAEKIVDAAVACLGRSPDASTSEIARAAGVGRVTLYGHFPTREALVESALTRLLDEGDQVLERLDLTGDPREVLRTLIQSGWLLMAEADAVLEAAQAALPPGRIQELHAKLAQRLESLIARGQAEGVFRADLPASWMASVLHHIMKGAAVDVREGRLKKSDAPRFISETVLAAYRQPRKRGDKEGST
jgi:TetR/AcrR family transcriptional repressor of mexCD-oprJ operon